MMRRQYTWSEWFDLDKEKASEESRHTKGELVAKWLNEELKTWELEHLIKLHILTHSK